MSIVVLCPTRGRPERAAELVASFRSMTHSFHTDLVLVVDHDDPCLDAYARVASSRRSPQVLQPADEVGLIVVPGGSLTLATNEALPRVLDHADIIGHVGDDHRFGTPGWDGRIETALADPGVAYGDDGFRGPAMPTAWFVNADIVRALGWLALPGTRHLYIDKAWKALGTALGRLRYLPDVSIEHLHPAAGKAEWDEGYRSANAAEMYETDGAVYRAWVTGPMEADLARVRAVL